MRVGGLWQETGLREGLAQGIFLSGAGCEDPNLASGGDRRVPEGDSMGRRFGGNDGAIDCRAAHYFFGFAGEKGGDMAVLAHAEENQIQNRLAAGLGWRDPAQFCLGFGTAVDGKWTVARLRDLTAMDALAPDQSEDWRGLGVSILHKLVLDQIVTKRLGGTPTCRYVHSIREVEDDVAAKGCQLACLVPPATMDHVESIAGNREKMPPKSTYFYPKIVTGMVYHSLKKD